MSSGKTDINHHVYHLHYRSGFSDKLELKFSLGNLTDTGWYWSGSFKEKIFLLWLARLASANIPSSEKYEIFNFPNLQDYYRIAVNDTEQLYELAYYLTGDNVVWHFGEGMLRSVEDSLIEDYCDKNDLDFMNADVWVDFDSRKVEEIAEDKIVSILQGEESDSFYEIEPLPYHVRDFIGEPDLWELHYEDKYYLIQDAIFESGFEYKGGDVENE